MIYVTGDTHGDKRRFTRGPLPRLLHRGDALLVCGDFGFVWDGSPAEEKLLRWLGGRGYQILFVEGTHDNLDLLERYPVEELSPGAPAHHLGGGLWHLIRGQVYDVQGKSVLALGGGHSQEDVQREAGVNWWPQELPREEELPGFRRILEARGRRVDLVLSHQAPTNIEACITQGYREVTYLSAFMDEVQRDCSFGAWYFGSYHQNRRVPPKYHCLYDQVQPVTEP